MLNDSVPIAAHDEPTHHIVWDVIDQQTVRIRFEEEESDSSDGIPVEVSAERSATVAVVLVDMTEPLELIAQMARRDGISMHVVALPGPIAERNKVGVLNATINGWRRFQAWFPQSLREAENYIMRMRDVDLRKGSAIMFRLRLLANNIQTQKPPNGFDLMVLRLEQ